MLLEELKVPFRWYDAENIIDPLEEIKCKGFNYKLITPKDRLLPIMLRWPKAVDPDYPISWKIYNYESSAEVADLTSVGLALLHYYSFGDFDYIIYKGEYLGINLESGYYYSVIELDGGKQFRSVRFWVDCDAIGNTLGEDFSDDFNEDFGPLNVAGGLRKYTKLEWWNDCDIDNLLYQTGYHNILYIDSDLRRDAPEIIEEGGEDGKKDFVPTFVKYIDKVNISDFVPEYVVTALLAIRIHKNVVVTTKGNLYTGKAKSFECQHTWQNGCYAFADCRFQQETRFLKANCCENNTITDNNACNVIISPVNATQDGNGNFSLSWNLVSGSPNAYRVTSPQISGGAPADVPGTSYGPSGPWANGTVISGTVKPRCVNPVNGVITYGDEQEWQITIETEEACVPVEVGEFELPDAQENSPYAYSIPLTGTQPFSLVSFSGPSWMSAAIVGAYVQLTGTPGTGDAGENIEVDIEVSNCGGANTDTIDTAIDVQEGEEEPEGNPVTVTIAYDPGGLGAVCSSPETTLYIAPPNTSIMAGITLYTDQFLALALINAYVKDNTGKVWYHNGGLTEDTGNIC